MAVNTQKALAESVETAVRLGFELFGAIPGVDIRKDDNSILIRTGAKIDLCNGVFKIRWSDQNAEREIDRYLTEFAKTGTPFLVHTTDLSTPHNVGEILKRRGFKPQPVGTMFTLDFDALPGDAPLRDGLSCSRVTTKADIDRYLDIFVQGFALPPLIADIFRKFYENHGCAEEKTFQSLVMSEAGVPVAIISILGNRDVRGRLGESREMPADLCTMMNLTVSPTARGRWLGTRMAREGVKFARACGYRRVCTSGTPDGMGIYRRAPLQEVGKCQRWSWNPE